MTRPNTDDAPWWSAFQGLASDTPPDVVIVDDQSANVVLLERLLGSVAVALNVHSFTDPEAATDGTILRAMVEQALSRITPNQREIVMLRDIEGLENEEIAEVLGWNLKPGAIRKRVFDAREAFRKAMIALGYKEEYA